MITASKIQTDTLRCRRGISLIELMAVIAIIAITMAVSVPQVIRLLEVNRARTTAWDLLRDLRYCQEQAMARAEKWGASIDSGEGSYFLYRGNSSQKVETRRFPEGVEVTSIKFGTQKSTVQEVSFNGNGNPVQGGGSVVLQSTITGKEFKITVSVFPGKIKLME